MTKQQMVDYLRTQSYWIAYLANEIENEKEITCAWAVDLDFPEYQKEVVVMHEQLKLNAELHDAVEKVSA